MALESETINLQFSVTRIMNQINSIISQSPGYLVIDTNYGEEYVDLNEVVEELGLIVDLSKLNIELRNSASQPILSPADKAYIVADGIAFMIIVTDVQKRILATDLKDLSCRASFIKHGNSLELSASSFNSETQKEKFMKAIKRNADRLLEKLENTKPIVTDQ